MARAAHSVTRYIIAHHQYSFIHIWKSIGCLRFYIPPSSSGSHTFQRILVRIIIDKKKDLWMRFPIKFRLRDSGVCSSNQSLLSSIQWIVLVDCPPKRMCCFYRLGKAIPLCVARFPFYMFIGRAT